MLLFFLDFLSCLYQGLKSIIRGKLLPQNNKYPPIIKLPLGFYDLGGRLILGWRDYMGFGSLLGQMLVKIPAAWSEHCYGES